MGTKKYLSAKSCAKPTSFAELYVIANKSVLLLRTACQNGHYGMHATVHCGRSLLFAARDETPRMPCTDAGETKLLKEGQPELQSKRGANRGPLQ